jgi:hypothetical protein
MAAAAVKKIYAMHDMMSPMLLSSTVAEFI